MAVLLPQGRFSVRQAPATNPLAGKAAPTRALRCPRLVAAKQQRVATVMSAREWAGAGDGTLSGQLESAGATTSDLAGVVKPGARPAAEVIDGKAIAEAVRQELKVEVAELKQKHGKVRGRRRQQRGSPGSAAPAAAAAAAAAALRPTAAVKGCCLATRPGLWGHPPAALRPRAGSGAGGGAGGRAQGL